MHAPKAEHRLNPPPKINGGTLRWSLATSHLAQALCHQTLTPTGDFWHTEQRSEDEEEMGKEGEVGLFSVTPPVKF